jgi:glucan 1,4-alpha-glucosidase
MKKIILPVILFLMTILTKSNAQESKNLSASLEHVKLDFTLNVDGKSEYSVSYKQKLVIKPSRLGFKLEKNNSLDSFTLLGSDEKSVDETWKPVLGEVSIIRNHYKQLTVRLQQKNAPNMLLNLVFKVFADGVGFRYEFPIQKGQKYLIVTDELTEFNLMGNHTAFWIPGDYDSNEYSYTNSKLSEVNAHKFQIISYGTIAENIPDQLAVQTPLMLKTEDGLYINIHEAALVDYPAMMTHVNTSTFGLTAHLVPDASGNKAYLKTPSQTPWRTIIVSDKATEILASKMILNLNEPSKIGNTSWIKPTKFMGVWWEMQIGKSSWNYTDSPDSLSKNNTLIPNKTHGANNIKVKQYIDFASKHGIKGMLVEGWNTGWEGWYGNWQGGHFDFITPYPDFNLAEISQYAKQKNVEMIMHNETSGDAATYERQQDKAFSLMNKYGYNSVKTGYVGKIIPRGEHHDGQWMVNHYVRAAAKAAEYKVMIDMHEPVRPTGLHRTYPNFIASEASRGNEWNAFSEGNAPDHETILPFTRLMGGPIDYTPGIFKIKNFTKDGSKQVHTTLAKQLALYVAIYSPLQMAADLPENYEAHLDAFQFIKDIALDWDDTKIIEAEPGDYLTIARKEKGKNNWFVGAITDENSRTTTLALDFLDKNITYTATIYRDADNADWKNNPEAYTIEKMKVNATSILKLNLAKGGGTAISIVPVKK